MTDTMFYDQGLDAGVDLGASTYVSDPHGYTPQAPAAPGANGPGSNMTVHQAALWIIGTAAVALVAIGVIFRRPIGQD